MVNLDIFVALLLITANPSIDELPKPNEEFVYCWLSVQRNKEGIISGFIEECREE